jgi:GMP synthase (glutamine-hydrolysing)
MRGTGPGARTAAVRSGVERAPLDGTHPRVVLWEADGTPHRGRGYGDAIAARLAAAGIGVTTVPLTRRRPSPEELAAPVHVLSGGATPATSRRRWVRSARLDLEPVLVRALAGEATVTGICFGAQLIAATLAGPGAIGPNPQGMEVGLTLVRPPAASDAPSIGAAAGIAVAEFHHHLIEPAAVAALDGEILLSNDHTAVQAFAIGPTIVGLQFHPELDPPATRATIRTHRDLIRAHGATPAAALASVDRLSDSWRAEIFDRFVVQPARRAAAPPARALDDMFPTAMAIRPTIHASTPSGGRRSRVSSAVADEVVQASA